MSPSDLVQESLLKAHAKIDQFQDGSEEQLVRWLQTILLNTWRDEVRKALGGRRNIDLDRSLDAAIAGSSARLEDWLAAQQSSPSQSAERHELLIRLADALAELSGDERDAVMLHHMSGKSVKEIAVELDRTTKAVTSLLYRGLKKLRERLKDNP
jgi:RNA polymerase sigma-70 factor (ECF subfamily)